MNAKELKMVEDTWGLKGIKFEAKTKKELLKCFEAANELDKTKYFPRFDYPEKLREYAKELSDKFYP